MKLATRGYSYTVEMKTMHPIVSRLVFLQITEDIKKKKLETKRQKELGETIEETSGCVGPKQDNKWPDSMIS